MPELPIKKACRQDDLPRPSAADLLSLFSSTENGLILTDDQGSIIFANPSFLKMTGYDEDELRGLPVHRITPEKWRGLEDIIIRERLARQGRSDVYEKEFLRKDGTVFPAEVTAWRDSAVPGAGQRTWASVRDITARKKVADLLEEDILGARTVIDKISDGVTLSDDAGRFTIYNGRMLAITGYSMEEANEADDFTSLLYPDPRERAEALRPLAALVQGGPTLERETVIRTKGSGSRELFVTTTVVPYQGRPMFLSAWRDVTDRNQAQRRVARQSALLGGMVTILQAALSTQTRGALARACLTVAERITGSRFGFIAETDGDGAVDILAVSSALWEACRIAPEKKISTLKHMVISGVCSIPIRMGRPAVFNDIPKHLNGNGVPPGHLPITRFLGVPLKEGGTAVGAIALANKDGPYDDADRQDIETLSDAALGVLSRKRLEEEHDRLWNILESSLNEIYIFDPVTLKMEYANRGALQNTGYTISELKSLTPLDLKPEFDEASFWVMVEPLLKEEKKVHVFQTVHRRKDGSLYPVEVHLQLVQFGEEQSFVAIIDDLTETERIRESLRVSETRFRRLFETALEGMLILDAASGRVLDTNPSLLDLLGKARCDLEGRELWEVGVFSDRGASDSVLAELRDNRSASREDLALETQDGRLLSLEFSGNIFELEGKKAIHGSFRDITSRRQAEERIREVVDAKAKFASMVSHELRTPLTVIKECINLLSEEFSPRASAQQRELLEICGRNISRLGRLINNVLDFQAASCGAIRYDLKENDVNAVAKEVLQAMAPLADKKGLSLTFSAGRGIPILIFDRDKVIQVLTNLVGNALRATEKGGVELATCLEKGFVRVTVKDTGRGIAAGDIPKLFKSFQRLGERSEGGTGLGLAISKQIVEQHSGRIWAESTQGKGSAFHFVLPVLKG